MAGRHCSEDGRSPPRSRCDVDPPAGTTLRVTLGAPGGGTSTGEQIVDNTGGAVNLVTGVTRVVASALPIIFSYSADVSAGNTSGTVALTLTVTA